MIAGTTLAAAVIGALVGIVGVAVFPFPPLFGGAVAGFLVPDRAGSAGGLAAVLTVAPLVLASLLELHGPLSWIASVPILNVFAGVAGFLLLLLGVAMLGLLWGVGWLGGHVGGRLRGWLGVAVPGFTSPVEEEGDG